MALYSLSGDPTKKKGVDNCADGQCAPKTKARMNLGKFSPTKSRYNIPKASKKKPSEPPTGNLHMNMNNLSGEPGDTQMQKQSNKSAITPEQEKSGRTFDTDRTKQKKALKLPRRKQ